MWSRKRVLFTASAAVIAVFAVPLFIPAKAQIVSGAGGGTTIIVAPTNQNGGQTAGTINNNGPTYNGSAQDHPSSSNGGRDVSVKGNNNSTSVNQKGGVTTQNYYDHSVIIPGIQTTPACTDLRDAVLGGYVFEPMQTVFGGFSNKQIKIRVDHLNDKLYFDDKDYKDTVNHAEKSFDVNADFSAINKGIEDAENAWRAKFVHEQLEELRNMEQELLYRLKLPWPICSVTTGLSVDGARLLGNQVIISERTSFSDVARYFKRLSDALPDSN